MMETEGPIETGQETLLQKVLHHLREVSTLILLVAAAISAYMAVTTGTLTQNKMIIKRGWQMEGEPTNAGHTFNRQEQAMLELLAACTNAAPKEGGKPLRATRSSSGTPPRRPSCACCWTRA